MNYTAVRYTPLECLLLFQSLAHYGMHDVAFVRISDFLTNNTFVKDGSTYDAGRLKTAALRELFLQLFRDELRASEDGRDDGTQPGSRKRKAPASAPALPTIKDAEEHMDKLPALVDRLYAEYKASMVQAVREDERRYAILQREIEDIERAERDQRIMTGGKAVKSGDVTFSSDAQVKPHDNTPAPSTEKVDVLGSQSSKGQAAVLRSPALPSQTDVRSEGLVANSRESTRPSPPRNSDPTKPAVHIAPQIQHRPTSSGPHGLSPLQPSPYQPPPLHPQQQQQQPPGQAFKWEAPYGPPQHLHQPYPQGTSYPQFSSQQYPPQPYQPLPRGSFPSPHGLQHPHVPSSPMSLQHPHAALNGGHLPPGSPRGMPLEALAEVAGQQYRATSGSPMMQPPLMHGSPMQPPAGYVSSYPPQQRPSSGNAHPQYPTIAPQYQVPPNQGPPHPSPSQPYPYQSHSAPKPYPTQPNLVPENRQYNSPYNANQSPRPSLARNSLQSRPSLPGTPLSQGQPRFLTGTGTRWTPNPTGSTPKTSSQNRPTVEPISPILHPIKLSSSAKTDRHSATNSEIKSKKIIPKRGAQRTRAGSAASSVVARSLRSQSVASHADELSLDSKVKEEVATPLPLPLGLDDETGDTTADESFPHHSVRPPNNATPPSRLKRKRHESTAGTPREVAGPVSHVLWTRAFPKISASALESVTGHRHASMFAAPVKERDAPGYKSLILQPQDLKSIKSAILAGHRAATAAMPEDTPQAQSSVRLPISEDLVPPRGIINYAQLEKELMRMFANAIMFNADPDRGLGASWEEMKDRGKKGGEGYEIDEDGVVKDTKAMYADVEQIIGSLRSAERRSEDMMGTSGVRLGSFVRGSSAGIRGSSVLGDDEPDELAGDGDAPTVTAPKKRRKA